MKKVLLVTFSDNADHQDTLFGMYEEMRKRSDWDTYLLCIKTPKVELQQSDRIWLVDCPERPGVTKKTFNLPLLLSIIHRVRKEHFDAIYFESLHTWNLPIILYIYGCYMKERGKLLINTVVTTVMSNFGLYKAFDEQGIGYAKTAVGDKYVYEYMAKNGCRIGGEQSGHIIFSKYASTGDGILTSLKMMEVMLAKKLPMSKLAEPLKIYPQVLENVRVTDKKAAQDDEAVQAAVKTVAEALGDTGRILVRESGTEPVVRVMVEAPDHDTCQKYVTQVVETIKSRGYGV